jgi:hypothetical protein
MALLRQLMIFPAVGKPECLYALLKVSCVYDRKKSGIFSVPNRILRDSGTEDVLKISRNRECPVFMTGKKAEYSASRTEFCGIAGHKMYLKSHETGAVTRKPGPVGFVGCFVLNRRML